MKRTAWLTVALLLGCLNLGCVTRRYTVTSNPLGAMVYRNGRPLGPTPVDDHFVYYGKYKFTLIKDGYEPLEVEQEIPTAWYEFPGLDFISENIIPFKIRDKRAFHYELQPLQNVRPDEVLRRAAEMRLRGKSIGDPIAPPPLPLPPPGLGAPASTPPPGSVVLPGSGVPSLPPSGGPPTSLGPPESPGLLPGGPAPRP